MAAKKLPHSVRATKRKTPATKSSPRAPLNILDALKQGWGIDEQLSTWRFNGVTAREGYFRMSQHDRKGGRNSRKTLMISYKALYDMGVPYFFEEVLP
jgi:hypothetical protein